MQPLEDLGRLSGDTSQEQGPDIVSGRTDVFEDGFDLRPEMHEDRRCPFGDDIHLAPGFDPAIGQRGQGASGRPWRSLI